jgi:hypothetical protein
MGIARFKGFGSNAGTALVEKDFEQGGHMAVKELRPLEQMQRLTAELEELTGLLKAETRTRARWVIMGRINEIIQLIGEKANR